MISEINTSTSTANLLINCASFHLADWFIMVIAQLYNDYNINVRQLSEALQSQGKPFQKGKTLQEVTVGPRLLGDCFCSHLSTERPGPTPSSGLVLDKRYDSLSKIDEATDRAATFWLIFFSSATMALATTLRIWWGRWKVTVAH